MVFERPSEDLRGKAVEFRRRFGDDVGELREARGLGLGHSRWRVRGKLVDGKDRGSGKLTKTGFLYDKRVGLIVDGDSLKQCEEGEGEGGKVKYEVEYKLL